MGGEHRKLHGHNLIRPALVQSAVINTSFGITEGIGLDLYEGTSALTGEPRTVRLISYAQTLAGQVAIANRVALELSFGGLAAVGGDVDAVLTRGAFAGLDLRATPKLRLFTVDKLGLQVSGGVGVRYQRSLTLTPGVVVTHALTDPGSLLDTQALQAEMLQQIDALTITPTVMLAEGVGALGVQLSLGPSVRAYGSDVRHGVAFGAHGALDLRNWSAVVPVALTAEFVLEHAFAAADSAALVPNAETIYTAIGGLFYSGRRDLQLGATFTASPRERETLLLASMVLHYYF